MMAAEALRTARAAGVEIALDGDDLVLEASSPPPEPVLEALSRNKAGIVALLRQRRDEPSSGDIVARALPRETVRIVRVPCRFGSTRSYFICPGVVNGIPCGRRAVKLHGPGRYCLCRWTALNAGLQGCAMEVGRWSPSLMGHGTMGRSGRVPLMRVRAGDIGRGRNRMI